MKRLSLKNIKFSESLSEETNAFTADVYLDNKKFGYARNGGRGGSTDISPYPEKQGIYKEAVEYAENLPAVEFHGSKLDMHLDFAVDTLLEEWLKEKDYKKAILFKDGKNTFMVKFGRHSITSMLKTENGRAAIQKEVNKLKAEGHKILNTNLRGIKL